MEIKNINSNAKWRVGELLRLNNKRNYQPELFNGK